MSMDKETRQALDSYFKMKATEEERKGKVRRRPKIRFTRRGDLLLAKCPGGACSVDMEIQRGEYGDTREMIPALEKDVENAGVDIIRAKLDLVYGLATQDETMLAFQDARSRGQEAKARGTYARVRAASEIATKDIKGSVAKASALVDEINAAILVGDARGAVQIYADTLVPELKTIRESKYRVNRVAFDPHTLTTHLVQEPQSFSSFIQPLSQADKARVLVDIK